MCIRKILVACTLLVALSTVMASAVGVIPPGGQDAHKVLVQDEIIAARLTARGATTLVDYGAYRLMSATSSQVAVIPPGPGAEVRDDLDTIQLNSGVLRTRGANAAPQTADTGFTGSRLAIVQFAGPVLPEWEAALASGGARVVCHVPNNAYVVYGDAAALRSARSASAYVQWASDMRGEWKVDRAMDRVYGRGGKGDGARLVAVQMVEDAATNPATLSLISSAASGPVHRVNTPGYVNVMASLPAHRIQEIADRPDVVSVQPWIQPRKLDERQDQIVAGNLSGDTLPNGPGYLAWLTSKGFTQAQFDASGFVVDLTDSGVDNGTTQPNHPGLRTTGQAAGAARVVYNRLVGTANQGSTLKGCDGHGTINSHIIAGYNDASGFPHTDSSGYHYGLGVAPFTRVGSSVIFDPNDYTYPDFEDLISSAYSNNARISSNSWGSSAQGIYDFECQTYDALVRDAQPSTAAVSAAGNQEMVIVFSAGNSGPGLHTVGSPGCAKNVICVGASDNVQPMGAADGCGLGDDEASSAASIASFSSRGPCMDGRIKPDIVAPGTHVSGGVAQAASPAANGTADACYTGSGVCGGTNQSAYFPAEQQWYTASSGTSHSCPAVAGGAALIRQWFLNKGLAAPSPAMTKAVLVNSARYLTGTYAADTLPSASQGWGAMNIGTAFADTASILRDEQTADTFTATGQSRVYTGVVADGSKPVRVTLAWTDAPGSTVGAAWNNDLDLQVIVNGHTYLGNVFQGSQSVADASVADHRNNVESVVLPAGITGTVAVLVVAKNIVSDGVPNNGTAVDQDFALVAANVQEAAAPVLVPKGVTLTAESCSPANGAADPSETVTGSFTLANVGTADATNVSATLLQQTGVVPSTTTQTYGTIAKGATAQRSFTFTATGSPGDTATATLRLASGATSLGSASYQMSLGVRGPAGVATYVRAVPQAADDSGVISQTIVAAEAGVVDSLKVYVRLDHPYVANANLSLVGPDGTRVLLCSNAGAPGANFGAGTNDEAAAFCVFDDAAVQAVSAAVAPFVGALRPVEPLSAFVGKPAAGNWTLVMEDAWGSTQPVLHAWRLDITKRVYRSCSVASPGDLVAGDPVLMQESCANGVLDPAEVVTYSFPLRNIGGSALTNVVATLGSTDGVIPVQAVSTCGTIPADGSSSATVSFIVRGDCYGANTATLHVTAGGGYRADIAVPLHRGKLGTTLSTVRYTGTSSLVTIPDNGSLTQTVTVPDGGLVTDIKVNVRANHTWVGDLFITLTSPDGTSIVLDDGVGGSGNNLGSGANDCTGVATTFDDSAASSIDSTGSTAPFAGSYRPTQALAAFQGKAAAGVWKLTVADMYRSDTGTLGCWSLDVTTVPTDCCGPRIVGDATRLTAEGCEPANGAIDPNETVTVALPLRNTGTSATSSLTATLLPGGGVVLATSVQTYGVLQPGAEATERSFKLVADVTCGGSVTATFRLADGLADLGTVTRLFSIGTAGATVSKTYSYGGLPTGIPDGGVLTSSITVPDSLILSNLTVSLRLNHTYVSDLSITLTSPDGRSVMLMDGDGGDGDNVGTGVNTCSGTPTIFDDAAASSISGGTAPFAGSYRPRSALSAMEGAQAQGVWRLTIRDQYQADTGVLGCWSLNATGALLVCCGDGPYTLLDAVRALRAAGGLNSASDITRLDIEQTGASASKVDIRDAIRLSRKAAGLN